MTKGDLAGTMTKTSEALRGLGPTSASPPALPQPTIFDDPLPRIQGKAPGRWRSSHTPTRKRLRALSSDDARRCATIAVMHHQRNLLTPLAPPHKPPVYDRQHSRKRCADHSGRRGSIPRADLHDGIVFACARARFCCGESFLATLPAHSPPRARAVSCGPFPPLLSRSPGRSELHPEKCVLMWEVRVSS